MRRTQLFVTLALAVLLGACSSFEYTPLPPLVGAYAYPQGNGDGKLTVEITRIRANSKKVMLFVGLLNEGNEEIRFKTENVTLGYHGTTYVAHDFKRREIDVDVKPGQSKDKYWAFHVMEQAKAGDHMLTIRGISIYRDGEFRPIGLDLSMQVPLPTQISR